MRPGRLGWVVLLVAVALCQKTVRADDGSLVFKLLAVNPSDTESKDVSLRGVLPPEVKTEDVMEADGLDVAYDAQVGAVVVSGTATLKPKQSLAKNVLIRDVWIIPQDQFDRLSREVEEILSKLAGTAFLDRGRLLANGIRRRLEMLAGRQGAPFVDPQAHISQYREDVKQLQLVETELVSLRQLMVMAALNPDGQPVLQMDDGGVSGAGGAAARDGLSVLTTWRIVFMILGLLGVVSLSFFFVWQRQLKTQLARQAAAPGVAQADQLFSGGSGSPTGAPAPSPKTPLTP